MSASTVNAAGGIAFSALTVVASVYMLVNLMRQGFNKMRVRMLVGIVLSDLAIGLSTFFPQAMFLAGRQLRTGSKGCNAQAMIFTAALLSQPLISLFLAFSTFILVKHPLHPITPFIERYSCFSCLVVWAICFLHSGLWWHFKGFEAKATMCSYASTSSSGLDRNLIEFVPRTFVFIVLVVIYTRLFSFLRRPDQIDLSSHDEKCDLPTRFTRRYQRTKQSLLSLLRCACCRDPETPHHHHHHAEPWEAVSFVNINQLHEKLQPDSISKASVLSSSSFTHSTSTPPASLRLPQAPQLAYAHPAPSKPTRTITRTPPSTPRTSNVSLSMTEFFAAEPAPKREVAPPRIPASSAAQYFNRQASLLMLWFPLAYMATFLLSIICLAHHMSGGGSEVFSIWSLWMILMVGLIDAVVYGVVEVVVRRRVRQRMPSHFG